MNLKSEKGLALPAIIIIVSILLIIVTSALYVASNQTIAVDRTNTSEDALHIAEAGYYKYLWQLNDNSDFYKSADKLVDEFDPLELYSGSEAGARSDWAGYPKKYKATEHKNGSQVVGYYQIEIVPPSTIKPVVTIKSTGWTSDRPDIKRAIEVKVHKRQFTNYMDFSGDMRDTSNNKIYWGDGEQSRGPVFTNGTLRTNGTPVFHDNVTYCVGIESTGGTPDFRKEGQPVKGTPLGFPVSNSNITQWAKPTNGGYQYSGRTCILLDGNQLKIRNINVNSDEIVTRPLPASKVIHIDGTLFISGKLDGRLSIVTEDNIYITGKDPTNLTYNSATLTGGIIYANSNIPTSPSQVISNQCDDMLGLISSGNILVNTRYWPKLRSGSSHQAVDSAINDIKIQAAIFGLSANSYYGVDRYQDLGNMGFIKFTGSKIGNRVGATYQSSTSWGRETINGYREDNSFDYRMAYETPPHFLEPTNSGWEVKEWKEITVAP